MQGQAEESLRQCQPIGLYRTQNCTSVVQWCFHPLQVQLGHVFGGHRPEAGMGPLATGGARRCRQSLLRVDHSPPHLRLEVLLGSFWD